jgi:hypothetical protein
MPESEKGEVHPEYGKLLYKLNPRATRNSIGDRVFILIIVGIMFIFILLLQLFFISESTDRFCLMVMFGILGGVSIFAGLYEAIRKNNIRFELYENGYIDHFYGATVTRSGPIDRYYLKNDIIYGITPSGKHSPLLIKYSSPSYFVFDAIVKELTLDGEPEAEDIFELLEPDYSEKNYSITIPEDQRLIRDSIPFIVGCTIVFLPFLFIDVIFGIILWIAQLIFFISIGWIASYLTNPKRLPNKFIITDNLIIAIFMYDAEVDSQENKMMIQIDQISKCVILRKRWKRYMTIHYQSKKRSCVVTFSAPHSKEIESDWDRLCNEISSRVPSGAVVLKK